MSINELLTATGMSAAKPIAGALLLPPLPLLAMALLGAALLARRHLRSGWALVLIGVAGVWLTQCWGTGVLLEKALLSPPPAFKPDDLAALRRTPAHRVVLVLGGGRESRLEEYGQSHLTARSAQRLHYALFVARRIDAPVMFSGGIGRGSAGESSEAEVAARIAERDYGVRLRWLETLSRDTRENARYSLALLAREGGIDEIVLVTQSWHMPRALRAFREAAANWAKPPRLIAAPVSIGGGDMGQTLRWLPSGDGALLVRDVLHEWLGLAIGA